MDSQSKEKIKRSFMNEVVSIKEGRLPLVAGGLFL
jgi:hypothetical protein